jgi:hypothetical protein
MAKRAWRERGIAILWPERIKNAANRKRVVSVARCTYGEREARS